VVQFVTSLRGPILTLFPEATCATVLRSLFRFLRAQGLCDERLELAIPAIAHWRMATLPRCLTEQQVKQVLAAFDPPNTVRTAGPCDCVMPLYSRATTG